MEDIWDAAQNGKIHILKQLIANGIDINSFKNFRTPLMLATECSNTTSSLDTVRLLLDAGANVNLQDNDGGTALMLASQNTIDCSSLENIQLLLKAGANINIQNNYGTSALMYAIIDYNGDSNGSIGNIEPIELLLKSASNVNLQDDCGQSALMLASIYASSNSFEIAQLLLKSVSNIDLQDTNGCTALMYAAAWADPNKSSLETVKLLLDAGANTDLQNNKGENALTFAYHSETVKLLLDAEANPFIDTTKMKCQSEDCLRAIETLAWKRLYSRDLQTARILGQHVLSKDVWSLILLNERQNKLCKNLDRPTNKYLLEAFAVQVGAEEKSVKNMTKAQLCGLISRSIGRI